MKHLLVLAVVGGCIWLWPAPAAQAADCCYDQRSNVCYQNRGQRFCDLGYTPGFAGSNFHPNLGCDQVPICNAQGKCEQGSNCHNLQKWECHAQHPGYTFTANAQCGQLVDTGTCCELPPSGTRTSSVCTDGVLQSNCSLPSKYHRTPCAQVASCIQTVSTIKPEDKQSSTVSLVPEISIPNFGEKGKAITISSTSIGHYIRAIFIYFIWAVGGLAVIMVIYGGVKWVAAAGNSGRISDARDVINNAIIGLIIALTSVVLLNTINPRLTNLSGLDLKYIKKETIEFDNAPGKFGEALDERPDPSNPGKTIGGCKRRSTGQLLGPENVCAVGNVQFGWPIGIQKRQVTSRMGKRNPPAPNASSCHPGTDLSTGGPGSAGQNIVAPHDGRIGTITRGCGEYIFELHAASGYYTRFVHIQQLVAREGQNVRKGEVIAKSGGQNPPATCGNSPHLHIELYSRNGDLHDIVPCFDRSTNFTIK